MELILLGTVSSIVRNHIVVKIENPLRIPKLGCRAYDREGRRLVGIVSDIIGPTREPYAVIKKVPGASIKVGEELVCEARRRDRR